MLNFPKALHILRAARGISSRELARRTGYDASHISLIENGKRSPSLEALDKLATALQVDTWVLVLFASPRSDWQICGEQIRSILDRVATDVLLEARPAIGETT